MSCWIRSQYHVDTKTAKDKYFLTTADLSRLPYESGGWGYGRARFYDPEDLHRAAVTKYGEQGLMQKRNAREEKLARKQQKEREAAHLREQLLARNSANNQQPGGDKENGRLDSERERQKQEALRAQDPRKRIMWEMLGEQRPQQQAGDDGDVIDLTDGPALKKPATAAAPAPSLPLPAAPRASAPTPAPMDEATKRRLASLRLSCMRQAKRKLGTNNYGAPSSFRFELAGIDPPTFAALVGVPNDPDLRSFVKRGAWYNEDVDGHVLFGISESEYENIRKQIDDGVYLSLDPQFTCRFQPSTGTMSVSGSCDFCE